MVKTFSEPICIDNKINEQLFKFKLKPFLRYPGGKQRQLSFFDHLLPIRSQIPRTYVEPFVGGGSVFFHINPKSALLCDKNKELIDLYIGIRDSPKEIWEIYSKFPKVIRITDKKISLILLPRGLHRPASLRQL